MDILRTGFDAWGREILLGVSWDLLPVFFYAGVVIIIAHMIFARWRRKP